MKFEIHPLLPKYGGLGFHLGTQALMIILLTYRLDFIYRPL